MSSPFVAAGVRLGEPVTGSAVVSDGSTGLDADDADDADAGTEVTALDGRPVTCALRGGVTAADRGGVAAGRAASGLGAGPAGTGLEDAGFGGAVAAGGHAAT